MDAESSARQGPQNSRADRFNRRLAADPATRRNVKVAFQKLGVKSRPRLEFCHNAVAAPRVISGIARLADSQDLIRCLKDALRKQESSSQFLIMTGRPHRDCQIFFGPSAILLITDSDLQRFLDGNQVARGITNCAVKSVYGYCRSRRAGGSSATGFGDVEYGLHSTYPMLRTGE